MQINTTTINGSNLALVESDQIFINDAQDAVQLLMDCYYQGASKIIIQSKHINPDFFNLKTGFAGEILQKFSNYDKQLAIVGDFSNFTSKSWQDFIRESNKTGRILFVKNLEEAQEVLSKK